MLRCNYSIGSRAEFVVPGVICREHGNDINGDTPNTGIKNLASPHDLVVVFREFESHIGCNKIITIRVHLIQNGSVRTSTLSFIVSNNIVLFQDCIY
jgi:hypothetical protein